MLARSAAPASIGNDTRPRFEHEYIGPAWEQEPAVVVVVVVVGPKTVVVVVVVAADVVDEAALQSGRLEAMFDFVNG